MAGLFGSSEQRAAPAQSPVAAAVTAQAPVEPPRRTSAETASLAAAQTDRFTRRKGRSASSMLAGDSTGGISAGRMLGSVART